MKRFLISLSLISVIVMSCSDKAIKISHVCANNILLPQNVMFEFKNPHGNNIYDVYFYVNHMKQNIHKQIVFSFSLTTENKDSINSVLGIPLIDKSGNYIGIQQNDYWVEEKKILNQVRLPKGINKIYCKYAMPIDTIRFIKEFGVRIVQVN